MQFLLGFVVFHILHFTTRTIHPTALVKGAVYANAYDAFQKWWIVAIYVIAVVLLGFHLVHGLWSGAQTAGVDDAALREALEGLGRALRAPPRRKRF